MQSGELRPLGAGEILDCAVTLFVSRFVPMVAVLAVAIAPLMILSAVLAPGQGRVFTDIGALFSAGPGTSAARTAAQALQRDSASGGSLAFVLLASFATRLLMWTAAAAYAAAAYAGRTMTLQEAYAVGLRRWFAQLLVGLAFAIIGGTMFVPLFIAYILAFVVVGALIALKLIVAAAILGVIAAIVVLGIVVIAGAFVFMAYQLATVAVATNEPNPVTAISTSLRSVFARATLWRTVVGGLVALAVTEGGTIPLVAVGGLLTALTHIGALYYVVLGLGQVLLDGLVIAFVIVYAVDVRVRREGIDLLSLTQSPAV